MFKSARIKLTAWYLGIIMLISISFSFVVYNLLSHEVERFAKSQRNRIERGVNPIQKDPPPPPSNPDDPVLVEETKARIATTLTIINLVIIAISGLLGYFLAGKTLKPIQIMVDEQNRFISDASHEFRTPLTILKSSIEVFLRNKNSTVDEARNLAESSLEEVESLSRLSNSLLELSQYQKPNGNIKFNQLSLKNVVLNSIKKVEILAKNKNIKITDTVKDSKIYGNLDSLSDLFVIFLDNSIKYSDRDSEIKLISKTTDGHVIIKVVDNGVGIAKEDLEKVFDRFYRSDKSRTDSKTEGYGLGLSIAKGIVNLHKGSVEVESELKKGTTITVTLPLKNFS